jgi:hypothetical protein
MKRPNLFCLFRDFVPVPTVAGFEPANLGTQVPKLAGSNPATVGTGRILQKKQISCWIRTRNLRITSA